MDNELPEPKVESVLSHAEWKHVREARTNSELLAPIITVERRNYIAGAIAIANDALSPAHKSKITREKIRALWNLVCDSDYYVPFNEQPDDDLRMKATEAVYDLARELLAALESFLPPET